MGIYTEKPDLSFFGFVETPKSLTLVAGAYGKCTCYFRMLYNFYVVYMRHIFRNLFLEGDDEELKIEDRVSFY